MELNRSTARALLDCPEIDDFAFSLTEVYEAVYGLNEGLENRLKKFRGIYLLEFSDGELYVGSALGSEGFFGRWAGYIRHSVGQGQAVTRDPELHGLTTRQKLALPQGLARKFYGDQERIAAIRCELSEGPCPEEDYLTFYILHTKEGQEFGWRIGLFDQRPEVLLDRSAYAVLADNQPAEKFFKELFEPELNMN